MREGLDSFSVLSRGALSIAELLRLPPPHPLSICGATSTRTPAGILFVSFVMPARAENVFSGPDFSFILYLLFFCIGGDSPRRIYFCYSCGANLFRSSPVMTSFPMRWGFTRRKEEGCSSGCPMVPCMDCAETSCKAWDCYTQPPFFLVSLEGAANSMLQKLFFFSSIFFL